MEILIFDPVSLSSAPLHMGSECPIGPSLSPVKLLADFELLGIWKHSYLFSFRDLIEGPPSSKGNISEEAYDVKNKSNEPATVWPQSAMSPSPSFESNIKVGLEIRFMGRYDKETSNVIKWTSGSLSEQPKRSSSFPQNLRVFCGFVLETIISTKTRGTRGWKRKETEA